jgi:hypothetical protein
MTPLERLTWDMHRIARILAVKASTDSLSVAVGEFVGAAWRCGAAWCTAAASWTQLIGGRR